GMDLKFRAVLPEADYRDLVDVEGTANCVKVLTQARDGVPGGLRLSYATLGAFTKYPKGSLPKKPSNHVAVKKFGYFQSERDFFMELAGELGLAPNPSNPDGGFYRHPLTYLVEAADDICYTI